MFCKCADPDWPYLVEQNWVARYDNVINVGEDGDELPGGRVWAGWKGDVCEVLVKFVDDRAEEDTEDSRREAFTLEDSLLV